MTRYAPTPALLLAAALAVWPLAAAEPVFFNRDRSASFPDAHPPFVFDGKTSQNILWKARLPNWCNGGPLVAGGRVFCVAEPWEGYAPWLLCLDAETGKELWRRRGGPAPLHPQL